MATSDFRQTTPRATFLLEAQCFAVSALFAPWETLPPEIQDEFEVNGGIPCDGSGLPGEYCADCRFGAVEEA